MKFRCRTIKPATSPWREVEAESVGDAVQTFHADGVPHLIPACLYNHELGDGQSERVYFSLVEIEGHDELVGRTFSRGISRKGGVKRPLEHKDTLEGIAAIIGWTHPVETLLGKWDGEAETWE